MEYELIKNNFINLKKEELNYIDSISKISSEKILSEIEKLKIYRVLNNYEIKLKELLNNLKNEIIKNKQLIKKNLENPIIEFDINTDFLSSLKSYNEYHKNKILRKLGIDINSFKFKLTLYDLSYYNEETNIIYNAILNNQKLIEIPIYIFTGYYDSKEDCYGPICENLDNYIYGIYKNIINIDDEKEIPKNKIKNFEKNKVIINCEKYLSYFEIKNIFEEELLNSKNNTLNDCIINTKNRIQKLNYTKSKEYKEKMLLNKINKLYEKNNNKFIRKEKNIVLIVGITDNKKYIVTFQNKINNKNIAEFLSIDIDRNEDILETAKKKLYEKTDYTSNDLSIIDTAYSSLESSNYITHIYIVIANNCVKNNTNINDKELINFELFSDEELNYLINNNIMNNSIDKLAYYSLINNHEDKIKIYKKF